MLVDHERVLADLKAILVEKPQHGAAALISEIARLEVKYRVEESLPEEALRLYGVQLSTDLRTQAKGADPAQLDGSSAGPMESPPDHRSQINQRSKDDGSREVIPGAG